MVSGSNTRPSIQSRQFIIVDVSSGPQKKFSPTEGAVAEWLVDLDLGPVVIVDIDADKYATIDAALGNIVSKIYLCRDGPSRTPSTSQKAPRVQIRLQLNGPCTPSVARNFIEVLRTEKALESAVIGTANLFVDPQALLVEMDTVESIVSYLDYLADIVLVSKSKALIMPKEELFDPTLWASLLTRHNFLNENSKIRGIHHRQVDHRGRRESWALPQVTVEMARARQLEARLAERREEVARYDSSNSFARHDNRFQGCGSASSQGLPSRWACVGHVLCMCKTCFQICYRHDTTRYIH